jgi:nicotinamide N-methyltransferase
MSSTIPHESEDMIDVMGSSLDVLYEEYTTIAFSSANEIYRYTTKDGSTMSVKTPDTAAANWALHASSVWVSAIFLADHITKISKSKPAKFNILELGAGAGLPSIVAAKAYPDAQVIVSDYPDDMLISTIAANVKNANVEANCRAVGYGWGTDPNTLMKTAQGEEIDGFDVVIAADTLWNSETHDLLADSLSRVLRKSSDARIHLIAGLHTGRWAIQKFMTLVTSKDLEIVAVQEHAVREEITRPWAVERDEDDSERRKWVIWIELKWTHV